MKRFAPLALVLLVGCSAMMPGGPAGPKKYLPDAAEGKAFKAGQNALAFLEGNWVEEDVSKPTARVYTFEPNGKFVFVIDGKKLAGQATVGAETIALDYRTIDDEPLSVFMEKAKKAEESGRQGAIVDAMLVEFLTKDLDRRRELSFNEDLKSVFFGRPAPPSTGNEDMTEALNSMKLAGPTLVRAKTVD